LKEVAMVSGALLIIPVLVLVSVGVMLAVFLDVAFSQRARRKAVHPLPLMIGNELRDWGVKEGRTLTQNSLASHAGKVDPVVLAQTATAFADDVLARTLHLSTPHVAGLNCRDGNGEVPRVTMPEALSIVEELQQRGTVELLAVRQRARRNLAAPAGAESVTALAHCPLRTIAGTCACALSRPLACSGRCLAGYDQPAGDAGWGRTLGEGLLQGMQAELRNAGLDGDRYELNEVLAQLPDVPEAAARWQRGEHLLAAAGNH
jgi:hypothetical protein